MKLIKGFYMALGMFCAVPLPFHIWDEALMPVMVASLPLVGLLIGAVWWGASLLLTALNLPHMLVAAVLTVVPFWVAGFIHLDGFMDTSDAHLSRRNLEDKYRILKDPNVGAFAVIMVVILILLQFSAMYSITENADYLTLLITVCVLSRSCSALSVLILRHMPGSNYAAMIAKSSGVSSIIFVVAVALVTVILSFIYAGVFGLIVCATIVVGYAAAMRVVYKSFKGISGDLLGYAMVIGELCGIIALALIKVWSLECGV